MRRLFRHLPFAVFGVLSSLVSVSAGAADAGAPAPLPACIGVKTDARWVPYGYNHVVIVTNGCSRDAACSVSTDVNPDAQKVNVPRAQSVELTTFLGSASSTFVAKVTCSLR
jgi:hypothetical protein